jgi:hypothetical protein
MINDFYAIIEKQMISKFTGKLNLMSVESDQYLGHINILNGLVVYSTFKNFLGLRSFYTACFEFDDNKLRVLPEAEIIDENLKNIHYPFSIIKKKSRHIIETYKKNKSKRPPAAVNLLICTEFVDSDQEIDQAEFDTLVEISKYSNIGDLYENSHFTYQELTNNLVSLRKKKSVKVYR